jgi:hypothetical protein
VAGDWRATAGRQHGLITHRQLEQLGVSRRRWGGSEQGRELVRVRPAVYADAVVLAAADPAGRAALRVLAECLHTGRHLVAAGRTSAQVHGLPVLGAPGLVLVERKQDRPHHGTGRLVLECDVVEVRGAPVLSVPRTVVDVARRDVLAGVVVADAALRRGVDRELLLEAVDLSRRWPGRLRAEEAVHLADPQAESPLESLGRVQMVREGLPAPASQVWITDADGPFARVDHCWREHRTVAEADGALKYASPADLFAEKRREDRLREAGWEVVRYTWDDALRTPRLLAGRVRAAFARAAVRAA